jgi:hypothetical protein
MAFEKDIIQGGVEVIVRFTEEELKILKHARRNAYDNGPAFGTSEEFIRALLYWEIMALQFQLGEVEKFQWQEMLEDKEPTTNLRVTHPELFVKSGGIVRDRKIPQAKPKFPALMRR